MDRLEQIVAALPEAERVDIEEWGGHPAFRVRNKNFVFSDLKGESLSFRLSTEEAAAVVATDHDAHPAGYGLGRHCWIALTRPPNAPEQRWEVLTGWIRTSYTLVAPKRLARIVVEQDGAT